jgi:hypothetical protein
MRHDLKCRSKEFRAMVEGIKNFEFRVNDRDFKVGDELILHEVNPDMSETGDTFNCKVSYILHGDEFGLPKNTCIMSVFGGFLTVPEVRSALIENTSIKDCKFSSRIDADRR